MPRPTALPRALPPAIQVLPRSRARRDRDAQPPARPVEMIRFTSLAAGKEIGAHAYLLEFDSLRVVLDAGTHPKRDGLASLPRLGDLPFGSVDAILLSHAHLDHSGALPVMAREHPGARILMSEATRVLSDALLHNSVNVMTSQRDELRLAEYPLYTHRELERLYPRWETAPMRSPFPVTDGADVRCEFFEAGHILGASAILLERQGHRILYTGDIHFEEQSVTRGAALPTSGVDTVIVETTRGNVARDPDYTREREMDRLAGHINEVIKRGGSVLAPVFAMGKTQELLVMLHDLKQRGEIPDSPIHIGGLGTKMTRLYDMLGGRPSRLRPNMRILEEVRIVISSSKKRAGQMEYHPRCIYALSSGMMSPKTVSNIFARQILENERCGLFFVGYADPESPAGRILATDPGQPVQLDPEDRPRALRCEVQKFDFSGHATRESILSYLETLQPSTVILVHGDEAALAWFGQNLPAKLPKARIVVPEPGTAYDLL
ncbi:MAG: MBL fold metallo-hydrolase [Verrucomicrobia bacterium]|nr:MBL fold metallo-hydrolase [Verrucomicrobiota bacterium]